MSEKWLVTRVTYFQTNSSAFILLVVANDGLDDLVTGCLTDQARVASAGTMQPGSHERQGVGMRPWDLDQASTVHM